MDQKRKKISQRQVTEMELHFAVPFSAKINEKTSVHLDSVHGTTLNMSMACVSEKGTFNKQYISEYEWTKHWIDHLPEDSGLIVSVSL